MNTAELQQVREEFVSRYHAQPGVCAWIWDMKACRLHYTSPAVEFLLGYTQEEALCRSPEEWMTPASLEKIRAQNFVWMRDFFIGKQHEDGIRTADYDYRCKDGGIRRLRHESRCVWDETAQNLEVFILLREAGSAQTARICCFGKFLVFAPDSRQPLRWRTKKAEELAAFFFSGQKREVGKWEICEALWPDCDPEKTSNHLHITLYSLKKMLHEAGIPLEVKYQNGYYHLTPPPISSDIDVFDELAATGVLTKSVLEETQVRRLEKAVFRYENDYMDENGYPWAQSSKEHYRMLFKALAKRLAEHYFVRGDYVSAQKTLRKILAVDNLCEDAHELLLRTLLATGDRIGFRRHYRRVEQLFRSELEIPPRGSIQALYQSMGD